MTESVNLKDRSWLETIKAFKHPRVITMLFLGFSAGTVSTNDMTHAGSISFLASTANLAGLGVASGEDLAVRLVGVSGSNFATYDSIAVTSTGGGGGSNDYSDWIADYPGVGGLTAFADDADGDGNGN